MIVLLLAVAVALPAPDTQQRLADAGHAIAVGRLEQARLMIGHAIAAGTSGPALDRVMADLAFASGNNAEAAGRFKALLAKSPDDTVIAESAGIAALRGGDTDQAAQLIGRAASHADASWRTFNALGVIADQHSDWPAASAAYAHAATLAPNSAEVANNQGWSQLLQAHWTDALNSFQRATALAPRSTRIANNLELARSGVAADLPHRRDGESDRDWAARLNDAGVAAQAQGDTSRAVAAFSQAIEASDGWYLRAANNLRAAQGGQ